MKIIHCADIHLDSKLQTHLSAAQAQTRNLEILDTFERMIDYAQDNAVQVIMIAGDLFDTNNVTSITAQRVINTIKKHPQIDFLYLSGNHDETNLMAQIKDAPKNLKMFHSHWTTLRYGAIHISSRILETSRSSSLTEGLNLDPYAFNIVMLHGEVGKNIDLRYLTNQNIDYLALGHLHSYAMGQIDKRGRYCYSGCLEGRGFDECGPKGFVLLDISPEQHRLNTQFIKFAKRELLEVKFDITGFDDWFTIEDQIFEQVRQIPSHNMLKVTLIGKYPLTLRKQTAMLLQKLSNFYFVKINDLSVLELSVNDVAHDFSLRGEFMRLVMAANLDAAQKEQIILCGVQALAGELPL